MQPFFFLGPSVLFRLFLFVSFLYINRYSTNAISKNEAC